MKLLLLSNSASTGARYLEHAVPLIGKTLSPGQQVVFIPFAGVVQSWDAYTDKVRDALSDLKLDIVGVHTLADPLAAIATADAVMVGGGNTFNLLRECRLRGLLKAIPAAVRNGAFYVGWSAGANLACPTIRTTNDMPIVDPGGLDALNLFPVQINPHFTNALPAGHQGETREQRIRELLALAPELEVIGLPEGNWIERHDDQAWAYGPHPTLLFKAGEPALTLAADYPLI
ncbi:(alpha)-aspartyl dipeptidase [Erwinia typographi]|uniref:dipeptidase E n=1 Tax=Erwinia typographi TaxID=371042 RepID=A0A0A3Z3F9_9GAMM|nr:dipeptidase PepE [Erwinia typographi]KGT92289.1 (alpha)-aspartyl dipeptidase [Erwinia typographi]